MYEVTYKYSDLEKEPQFGIRFTDDLQKLNTYNQWVWFYLGELFEGKKPKIYPYKLQAYGFENVETKTYKNCYDAKRQAKLIHGCITRQLKKLTTP